MKTALKNIFYFITVIFLGFTALYGAVVPPSMPIKAISGMQIAPFESGLALYQGSRKLYYSLSPFNDYYLTADGVRSSFITQEEIKNKSFTTNLYSSHLGQIKRAISYYLGDLSPAISFSKDKNIFSYSTQIADNKVVISRQVILSDIKADILGTTLSYSGLDFIIDKEGNLYTYQKEEDLNFFQQTYGIFLNLKTDQSRIYIADKSVVIFSPILASVLVVRASSNQTLWINKNTHLIEIEESVSGKRENFISSIQVEVYDNPVNAMKYL